MLRNRMIRRAAGAGALIATLTLAAPAQAAGWTASWAPATEACQSAWAWLAKIWPGSAAPARPAARGTPGPAKQVGDLDTSGTTNTSTPSVCDPNCERSSGIDPNG